MPWETITLAAVPREVQKQNKANRRYVQRHPDGPWRICRHEGTLEEYSCYCSYGCETCGMDRYCRNCQAHLRPNSMKPTIYPGDALDSPKESV